MLTPFGYHPFRGCVSSPSLDGRLSRVGCPEEDSLGARARRPSRRALAAPHQRARGTHAPGSPALPAHLLGGTAREAALVVPARRSATTSSAVTVGARHAPDVAVGNPAPLMPNVSQAGSIGMRRVLSFDLLGASCLRSPIISITRVFLAKSARALLGRPHDKSTGGGGSGDTES